MVRKTVVPAKTGVKTDEGCILAGYYGFNANISFTFQAVKKLSAHPTYLPFRLFCKFVGDFFGIFGVK